MIQIKYKNQGVCYILTLRQVLIDGMNEFCSKSCGSTDCKGCPHYAACSDVYRTIAHLDSMIAIGGMNEFCSKSCGSAYCKGCSSIAHLDSLIAIDNSKH